MHCRYDIGMLIVKGRHQLEQNIAAMNTAHTQIFHLIARKAMSNNSFTVLIAIIIQIADNIQHQLMIILRFNNTLRVASFQININIRRTTGYSLGFAPVNLHLAIFIIISHRIAQIAHYLCRQAADMSDTCILISCAFRHTAVVGYDKNSRLIIQILHHFTDILIVFGVNRINQILIILMLRIAPGDSLIDKPMLEIIDRVNMHIEALPIRIFLKQPMAGFGKPFAALLGIRIKDYLVIFLMVTADINRSKLQHRTDLIIHFISNRLRIEILNIIHISRMRHENQSLRAVSGHIAQI